MKLYLVSRTDDISWWEYISFIVAAYTRESALEFSPSSKRKVQEKDQYEEEWTKKENVEVEYIGKSNSLEEKIIHTSYLHG